MPRSSDRSPRSRGAKLSATASRPSARKASPFGKWSGGRSRVSGVPPPAGIRTIVPSPCSRSSEPESDTNQVAVRLEEPDIRGANTVGVGHELGGLRIEAEVGVLLGSADVEASRRVGCEAEQHSRLRVCHLLEGPLPGRVGREPVELPGLTARPQRAIGCLRRPPPRDRAAHRGRGARQRSEGAPPAFETSYVRSPGLSRSLESAPISARAAV